MKWGNWFTGQHCLFKNNTNFTLRRWYGWGAQWKLMYVQVRVMVLQWVFFPVGDHEQKTSWHIVGSKVFFCFVYATVLQEWFKNKNKYFTLQTDSPVKKTEMSWNWGSCSLFTGETIHHVSDWKLWKLKQISLWTMMDCILWKLWCNISHNNLSFFTFWLSQKKQNWKNCDVFTFWVIYDKSVQLFTGYKFTTSTTKTFCRNLPV